MSSSENPWVIASSALFFIPGIVAFLRQSIIVAIVFLMSALFSTLYHTSGQIDYGDSDVMWASMGILIALLMLAINAMHYPVWNWRVFVPVVSGITAVVLYVVGGQNTNSGGEGSHYDLYHSLWHVFITIGALALTLTPVDLTEIQYSYPNLYARIYDNYRHMPVNNKTIFH
jgi:hypothetical protein